MSALVLTVTRDFAAPAERIFDAWLDPADARRFLFATPEGEMQQVEIDARVGGTALVVERRASGDAAHRLKFVEIDRPRRLVFLVAADPAEEGDWTRVTIQIAATDSGCTLTLTHEMDPEWAAYEAQTRQGWTMILASLARVTERQMIDIERTAPDTIRFERILDAPRETVWRYLTEAEFRRRWFSAGTDARAGEQVELIFDHDDLSTDDVPYPEKYAPYQGAVGRERVLVFDPPSRFAISWDEGKEGVAEFELFDLGERTRLVLTHSGITGPGPMANFGGGWHSHLAVLQGLFSGDRVRDFWALHSESEAAMARALAE